MIKINKIKNWLIFSGLIAFLIPVKIANLQEEYGSFLVLDILLEENKVFLNPDADIKIDITDLAPYPFKSVGDYTFEFYKKSGDKIIEFKVDLKEGENIVYLPLVINSDYIIVKNKYGQDLGKIDIGIVKICNEDGVCSANEEYLCPLDCKNANNPYYPLTEPVGINIEKAQKETVRPVSTPTPPEKVFSNILLFTVIVLGIILVFVIIIFILRR